MPYTSILIIEDGTGVANANSYNSLAEIRAYAVLRGVVLSSVDQTLDVLAIKAMDWLEYKKEWYGKKTSSTQSLQWPRNRIRIDGEVFPYNEIPTLLKKAHCQLVVDQSNGITLTPDSSGNEPYVTEETIGPITTKYSGYLRTSRYPSLPIVESFLKQLCRNNGIIKVDRA